MEEQRRFSTNKQQSQHFFMLFAVRADKRPQACDSSNHLSRALLGSVAIDPSLPDGQIQVAVQSAAG